MEDDIMTTLTKSAIDHFAPSGELYQHSLNPHVRYTAGLQFIAEEGDACWLIDAIASWLTPENLRIHIDEDARVAIRHLWTLTVDRDWTSVLEAQVDKSEYPFIQHYFDGIDFPLAHLEIVANWEGGYWTLLLPSEV
jgi:hypothetical protein